jgi:Protein of unknown function (DUF2490)
MKFSRLICGIGMVTLPALAAAKPVEDTQLWTVITVTGPVKGNVVFAVEAQGRFVDKASRHGQTLFRGSIGVKVRPNLTLSLGLAHTEIFQTGTPDLVENRSFQQVAWTIGPVLDGTLSTRIRLEERWFKGFNDVGVRYRQTLRLQAPLTKNGVALITQAEIFFNLNDTDSGARAGFDQLRGLVGVSLPISKRVSLEASYQPIYVNGVVRDRLNHTFPVTLAIKL